MAGGGGFDPRDWQGGPPQIAAADLSRDPNVPSKHEQFRMAAVQIVAQLVGAGQIVVPADTAGAAIVGHAEAICKFMKG